MQRSLTHRLSNLLSVKSLVTLILTLVFAYLSCTGAISKDFITIYTVIIAFYFGTQIHSEGPAGGNGGGGNA